MLKGKISIFTGGWEIGDLILCLCINSGAVFAFGSHSHTGKWFPSKIRVKRKPHFVNSGRIFFKPTMSLVGIISLCYCVQRVNHYLCWLLRNQGITSPRCAHILEYFQSGAKIILAPLCRVGLYLVVVLHIQIIANT